ncbi:hypothetical protein GCM10022226_78420 [Sphaerisporangium flaviroseum]|uniref:Uncharacterized protein n=1 Tax=Sphaerisporangium flaviroseum TaxID=509199 RepID=A0ABP7JFH8_9ACTN
MIPRRSIAMLTTGAALAAGLLLDAGAAAAANLTPTPFSARATSAGPKIIKPRGCQTWIDAAGSGGAQRLHARCGKRQVHVQVSCPAGQASRVNYSKPWWRRGYNRADCQKYGWIVVGVVKTKK